jgi:hypothetical protein
MICSICQSNIDNLYVTACAHKFCHSCINQWAVSKINNKTRPNCPECRTDLLEFFDEPVKYDYPVSYMYGYESDFGYEIGVDDEDEDD